MPKMQFVRCLVENGTPQYVFIFEQNVNKSDDFMKVKNKIQGQLEEQGIDSNQLFYVCNEQVLNDNDKMDKFILNVLPDIKIYEITNIYKSFLDQLQEQIKFIQIDQERRDFANKISNLEQELREQQQKQQKQKEEFEKKINDMNQQNISREESQKRDRQNYLQRFESFNNDLMKQKKEYDGLQKDKVKIEDSYRLLQGEFDLLKTHNETLKKHVFEINSGSKIHAKQNLEQLQIEHQLLKEKYISEQKQNSENQKRIQEFITNLNEKANKLSEEEFKNKTLLNEKELDKKYIQKQIQQIRDKELEFNQTKNDLQKQLSDIYEKKQSEIQQLKQEFNDLQSEKIKYLKVIGNLEQDLSGLKQSCIKIKQKEEDKTKQLTEKEQQLSIQILQLQEEIQSKSRQYERLQIEINNLKEELEKAKQNQKAKEQQLFDIRATLNAQTQENSELLQKEKAIQIIQQKKLKKISAQLRQKMNRNISFDGKFISPTEKLFQNEFDINKFDQNPNVMTDENIYEVSQLSIDSKIMEQLLKQGELEITEAIRQIELGTWKIKRCLNPNTEGSQRSLYLIRIKDEPKKNFNEKIFVIKEFPSNPITTVEQAYQVATNSLISRFLLELFKKTLERDSEKQIPKNVKFQEQYLLTFKEKIYIAEPLYIESKYTKYNGTGESLDKDQKLTEFLNAFSLYSYYYSQKQFMITNLQGYKDNLYDPIISTNEGVFNVEDLGEDEITRILRKYNDNPAQNGKAYLQELGIKI